MSKMGDGLYIDWKHRIFSLASGVLSYFKEEGSKVPFWPIVTVGGAVAHMVVCFQELGTISLVQAEIAKKKKRMIGIETWTDRWERRGNIKK